MLDLDFHIDDIAIAERSLAPALVFRLRIDNPAPAQGIDAIALHCQIHIEAARRHYGEKDAALLTDLFGETHRWSKTLRSLLWTQVNAAIPAFTGGILFPLMVPCTYDLNIAATKFFHAIRDGDVMLSFLFSGSIYHRDLEGDLQISPIALAKQAQAKLSASLWHEMMARYYPDGAWLPLAQATLDRLCRFKARRGISDWNKAIDTLVESHDEERVP